MYIFSYKYITIFLLLWMPLQGYASMDFDLCFPSNLHNQAELPIHNNCHTADEPKIVTPCHHCLFCCCCDISIGLISPSHYISSLTLDLPHIINLILFTAEQPFKPPRFNAI